MRLPPIGETAEDELATELVAQVMRQMSQSLRGTKNRIVMRGGTAAKIGYGLPRPSRDIDIDLVGDEDPWTTLQQAAQQTGLTALAQPDRRRALKGALLLTDEIAGTVRIEVDIRRIRSAPDEQALTDGSQTEYRNGVLMYRAPTLVAQKFAMITLPEHRLRAKDRYDIAWWLTEKIEHVAPSHRITLDEQLRESPALQAGWDRNHRTDRILRGVDPDVIQTVLTATLDRDPAVLQRRWPDGNLILDVDAGPATSLTWCCNNEHADELPIAEFRNDQELERFMRRLDLWQPKDVPEQLKELTLERQRAIDATKSHDRG